MRVEDAARAATSAALGAQPPGLPARQFAWDATLARDRYGNAVAPRYDRLLFFDVKGAPTPAHARVLENALRTLERTYRWEPSGLLFTTGWGPGYFTRVLGTSSPVPPAMALSDFELPGIDDYDLCLHLASDEALRLAAIEAALVKGAPLSGAHGPLALSAHWSGARHGPVSSAAGCRPRISGSAASRPAGRCPRARRSTWASSQA